VGHPEGEPLHDKVMALKLEFKQFKKRVNERKENLKKHLSFCEQGKEVVISKLILFILDSSITVFPRGLARTIPVVRII
jgi:hypothetical protein